MDIIITLLYNATIFPIEWLINILYFFIYKSIPLHGISIIILSIVVNLLLLPFYNIAEKWQNHERLIIDRMQAKINDIKAVFKGNERHMIINTYYRQNNYHPIFALRSVLGLLIQLPFFIAAYRYLGHLGALKGVSFYFIKDLGQPDQLLHIGWLQINILPILMTAINIVSSLVYTKNLPTKEKAQLFGMSFLFLVLLYNSPSGLVVYWTCNNIISMIKNIIYATKNPKRNFLNFMIALLFVAFIGIVALQNRKLVQFVGINPLAFRIHKGKVLFIIISFMFFGLLALKYIRRYLIATQKLSRLKEKILQLFAKIARDRQYQFLLVLQAGCIIFLVTAFIIPTTLIATSVEEFSLVNQELINPLRIIFINATKNIGIFLVVPLAIYLLFTRKVKLSMAIAYPLLTVMALFHLFAFTGDYGILNPDFTFDTPATLTKPILEYLLNIIVIIVVWAVYAFLLIFASKKIIITANRLVIIASIILVTLHGISIQKDYALFARTYATQQTSLHDNNNALLTLSKTNENVVVFMLDRIDAKLFKENCKAFPELTKSFEGFTYYPNTLSYGFFTLWGSVSLFGGHEYTPEKINARANEKLVDKHNEALTMLPKLFLDKGYRVMVDNLPFANYSSNPDMSFFKKYPEIEVQYMPIKLGKKWIAEHTPKEEMRETKSYAESHLLDFAMLRIMPSFLRRQYYEEGRWINIPEKNFFNFSKIAGIPDLAVLEALPQITNYDEEKSSFIMMNNDTVHDLNIYALYGEKYFEKELQERGYHIPEAIKNDPYQLQQLYRQGLGLRLVAHWLDDIRRNEAFDNTKIIIVGDHGAVNFNPLLLVKDFNAKGALATSHEYMMNADTPTLATSHFKNPKNPFTGVDINHPNIKNEKIRTYYGYSKAYMTTSHKPNLFLIKNFEEKYIHEYFLGDE